MLGPPKGPGYFGIAVKITHKAVTTIIPIQTGVEVMLLQFAMTPLHGFVLDRRRDWSQTSLFSVSWSKRAIDPPVSTRLANIAVTQHKRGFRSQRKGGKYVTRSKEAAIPYVSVLIGQVPEKWPAAPLRY
jgi:hypothetical protein